MQSPNLIAEAKQLNITLEQEGDEWLAVLPSHPDLGGDEELALPAATEEGAVAEARAFRSIEQSSVYNFEYDEKADEYVVKFGDQEHRGKLLADTYAAAQKAYAAMINQQPPTPEAPTPPAQGKKRAPRKAANNGADKGEYKSPHAEAVAARVPPPPPLAPPLTTPGPEPSQEAQIRQMVTDIVANVFEEAVKRLRPTKEVK